MSENQVKGGQTRGHLTSKETSRWLVEGPEQSADQHVQNCWACQAKLAEAKAPLAAFRTAIVSWSEAQDTGRAGAVRSLAGKSERNWGIRLWLPVASLALAALLIAGFVKVPGLLERRPDGQQTAASSPSSSDSDAALMDQVDTEVSEAVPDAMAPLTDLVAWDSGEGLAETTPGKTTAHKKSSPVTSAKAPAHAAN